MKKTKLYKWHKENGKIIEFAGWKMPVWYSGIVKEHITVREGVGIFDISHMGEIYVEGRDSLKFLEILATNDVSVPPPVSGTYTLFLNERGAVKDEALIYNLGDRYMVVCDAIAYEKLVSWFEALRDSISEFHNVDVKIKNKTNDINLLSIQGPKACLLAKEIFDVDINKMWWFQAKILEYEENKIILSKSGYTGENGFELFFEKDPLPIWEEILDRGEKYGILPCGLGARDTLRIEAGYTLYGNETKEYLKMEGEIDSVTPIEAGFDKWEFSPIKWSKEFVGKKALLKQKKTGVEKKLIYFELEDSIPRPHYEIWQKEKIGEVTSGTKSPLTKKGIGIGFVKKDMEGEIYVLVRGEKKRAKVITPPFYDPKKYGAFREVRK